MCDSGRECVVERESVCDSGRECVMERENLCDNWPRLTGLIRSLNIYTDMG